MTVSRKITIYRVEHRDTGVGPYRKGNGIAEEMNAAHGRLRKIRHVVPLADGIETMEHRDVCGFVSRERLDTWFYGWKKRLHEMGYCIALYEVPMELVKFGKTQCIFRRAGDWYDEDLHPVDKMPMLR